MLAERGHFFLLQSMPAVGPRQFVAPSPYRGTGANGALAQEVRGARNELMPAAPNTNGAHGKRGEPNGLGPDPQKDGGRDALGG
jgi:hypothetical protein